MAAQLHPQVADFGHATLSAANTNRDGTGTLVTVLTGSTNKREAQWVRITGVGTTTEGMIRFFSYDGSTNKLLGEIKVDAAIPTATKKGWVYYGPIPGGLLNLPGATDELRMSTHNAETFHVRADYVDYVA